MSVISIRDRFLARVEQVRVRVPVDPELAADLKAAKSERARIATDYDRAVKDFEGGRRKLIDAPPEAPDYTEVDQWIEDAEAAVDANSIIVVLQWLPKVYAELSKKAVAEQMTALQRDTELVEHYYLRTEALDTESGDWVDLAMKWDDLYGRLTEGELLEIAQHAHALANASDAAPFVKRGTNSKTG